MQILKKKKKDQKTPGSTKYMQSATGWCPRTQRITQNERMGKAGRDHRAIHTTQLSKETAQIHSDAVLSPDTDVSPLNVASYWLAQTTPGAADEKQMDLGEKSARS